MILRPADTHAMELCSVITAHNIFAHQCDQHHLTKDQIADLQDLARSFMRLALAFYDSLPDDLAAVFGELKTPKFLNLLT